MTIEIHKPELETLILERMKSGRFSNVEEALIQALKSSPALSSDETVATCEMGLPTSADLIAVMQASPYRDTELEPPRERLPGRDVGDIHLAGSAFF